MLRSFKDKMKDKQDAYQAEQVVLAEQAKKDQKAREWQQFEDEQQIRFEEDQQILVEEELRQRTKYLEWKQEQKLLKEQVEPLQKIDSGIGIGHMDTWVLTWKSFSTHPDIIALPMSEKIRLFRLAERQQIDKINYYANLFSDANSIGMATKYWIDGDVDTKDNIGLISEDITWTNSVDVNTSLTVEAGVVLTVLGILTTNALITNYGTIIVNGLVVENVSIINIGAGQVIVG